MRVLVNIDGLDGLRRPYVVKDVAAGGIVTIAESKRQLNPEKMYDTLWPRVTAQWERVKAIDFDEQSLDAKSVGNTGAVPRISAWAAYWQTRFERTRAITQRSANREMLFLVLGIVIGAVIAGISVFAGKR